MNIHEDACQSMNGSGVWGVFWRNPMFQPLHYFRPLIRASYEPLDLWGFRSLEECNKNSPKKQNRTLED